MSDEQPLLLSTLPPTRGQKRLALATAAILLAVFLVVLPFAHVQLRRIDSFVPIIAMAMFLNDTITAALLLAQFAVLRTRDLLVLATGYLLTGLVVVTYALTFPGAFSLAGWLGAGLYSTSWLFIAWNDALPVIAIAYVLVKDAESPRQMALRSVRPAILGSIAGAVGAAAGLTWLVTVHHDAMPALMTSATEFNPLWTYVITPGSALLCVVLIALLWSRGRSLLDLWLLVVAWAWLLKAILWILIERRYSVAWYANTLFAISAATFVLIVLLSEATLMYARLALSVMEQRRQREGRLMTMDAVAASIAHEVNQPLAAIVNNGSAGLRWLARSPPDIGKASEALKAVVSDGHRANHVIAGIRAMFRRDEPVRRRIDINDVVMEALVLARDELRNHGVTVETVPGQKLPPTSANKVQLQQVLLNLIANAIEAMNAVGSRIRRLRVRTESSGQGVLVAVEDSGTGIDPKDCERIFDPLFTTKAGGMGLGLPICRSIVEAHGGRIWATPGAAGGTVLQFALPVNPPGSSDV